MPKMNPCFLLGNPEQTPLARGARIGVAHRRREETWRLPVRPLEAVLRGPCIEMAMGTRDPILDGYLLH
jgi:3-methyladenine DNA glycosylase Mpg